MCRLSWHLTRISGCCVLGYCCSWLCWTVYIPGRGARWPSPRTGTLEKDLQLICSAVLFWSPLKNSAKFWLWVVREIRELKQHSYWWLCLIICRADLRQVAFSYWDNHIKSDEMDETCGRWEIHSKFYMKFDVLGLWKCPSLSCGL
jgi:hypothetical protein